MPFYKLSNVNLKKILWLNFTKKAEKEKKNIYTENRRYRKIFLIHLRDDSPPSSDIENQPVAHSPTISRIGSRSVSRRLSTSYRDSFLFLLVNYSLKRLDSQSDTLPKEDWIEDCKNNRYIIKKKIKLQEKFILTLKKKVHCALCGASENE